MLSVKHIATYLVLAGAIKTWQSGENINVADINSNFQHIHGLMVGGHGGRLVDADVNASANISTSKLQAYRQIPVAWGYVTCTLIGGCSVTVSKNISTMSTITTGSYLITLGYTATDTNYAVVVGGDSGNIDGGASRPIICDSLMTGASTTQFFIQCYDTSAVLARPQHFDFTVFDEN